jgi:RHS repeat-associated protein
VLSGTTTSYTYNADGQQLSAKQGSTTIASGTWNGAGELTTYSDGAANMSAATYDGNGLRASESSTPSGGSLVTQNFVWNMTSSVPNLLMDSTNAYIFAGSGTPAEQVNLSSGSITYLVADSLGSVRGVVTSSGSLSGSVDYDAWGNPETTGGLSSYTPFGFAGAYTDLSGMIYLIGRYYDPATGQFLSVDPLVHTTRQPYEYASDSPAESTDPSGQGCRGNIENSLKCPFIDITGSPLAEEGTGPTKFTFHIVVTGLSTIWPVSGTGGTAYVNFEGTIASGPIEAPEDWSSFGVAWLRGQIDGGSRNWSFAMVCDNWLGIEVYVKKGSSGSPGPAAAEDADAYNFATFDVKCVPFITLVF